MTQRTRRVGWAQAAAALGAMLLCMTIQAQATPGSVAVNIAAQPVGQALKALAQQTGIQLLVDAELIPAGAMSPSVDGSYALEDVLRRLLSGTSLEYDFINERTVSIRSKSAASSSSLSSDGQQVLLKMSGEGLRLAQIPQGEGARKSEEEGATKIDEVLVFGTLESSVGVGSKSGGTLRETPKSITIVTGERIQAQNLASLQEVLIQTTGVAVTAFNPMETFYYSRGIRLETVQFDGGAPAYNGGLGFFYTPDTAVIDQIEVLRGVDGMYSGAGEPGGVINLVRKRPEHTAAMRVDLSGGTWDNYRAILDGTSPLALDGRLRGRAVASYMDRGYHLDRYTTKKQILYGTMEFDATDSTLLAVGFSYEKRDDQGFPGWGTPRYSDGRPLELPREYNIAPRWTYLNTETKDAFARVEQKYGETGVIRLNLNQISQPGAMNYITMNGAVNPVTLAGTRVFRRKFESTSTQRMADLSASGKLELFGRSHSYTLGADYTKLGGDELGYSVGIIPLPNFFAYNPAALAETAAVPSSYYPRRERSQRGYYATIGLQLAEPLRLTLGGRYGTFRYDHALRTVSTGAMSYLRYNEEKFIPSAALTYSLSDRWTSYLSYGETFVPQGNLLTGPPPGRDQLTPVVGSNLELGIKGDVFQGVTAAASIYRLKRTGQGAADPTYLGVTDPATGSACCYVQQGVLTVEGMDLEMSGQVTAGWQLFGGYTFTQTEYIGRGTGFTVLGRTPKHQLKIWSTYRLPGRLSALTLNGGVTAQTNTYFGATVPPIAGFFDIPYGGTTLWNASVQYALTEKWNLAVYADNLTDKIYRQPTGNVSSQNVFGNPRSVTMSIRGRW